MLLPGAIAMTLGSGCACPGRVAAPGEAITLQPGQRVALPDAASLRYVAVTADSRCPPVVQCIRAGDADVAFEFVPAGGSARLVTLNTAHAPIAPIGTWRWRLRLLSLESGESPRATVRIDPSTR